MRDDERIRAAESLLGHTFCDKDLLLCALTHRSFVNERPDEAPLGHNERLEFLGDAVLSLIAAETLVVRFPDADEGELTRRRAAYVSEAALSRVASEAGLGELLRMGRGQRSGGGEALPSLLADATEALIAAAYLDGGLMAARTAVARLLGEPDEEAPEEPQDPKTVLQERFQKVFGRSPSYEVKRAGGPNHAPVFEARVLFDGVPLATAEGPNKKEATRGAARAALLELSTKSDEELEGLVGRKQEA